MSVDAAPSTSVSNPLKRKADSSDSEDLACKRRYYYVLASESEISESGSESIMSIQAKSTDLAKSTSDTCTKSSISEESDMVEFEVVSVSDSERFYNCGQVKESSSAPEDVVALIETCNNKGQSRTGTERTLDLTSDSDDDQLKRTLFHSCTWCNQPNSNNNYRFCQRCHTLRKNFLPARPKRKRGQMKGVRAGTQKAKLDPLDSGVGSSHSQCSVELCENPIDPSMELCHICMSRPKDGGFCHGNIIHVYSCYKCSVKTFKQSGRCPICNLRTRQIFRVISS